MKTLDIVIPFYNEEDCIEELFKRLLGVRKDLAVEGLETNFIFVNDGSVDGSSIIVENLARANKFIKLVNFSRNFGHEIAVTAGLDYSSGDYTAIIDSDLQDPPELLIEMYKKLKEGDYQVAYGKRLKRKSETAFKKVTAFIFYRLLNSLCETKLPTDTGDFRIITASVRESVKQLREHHRFMRGLLTWVGFKSVPVYYNRDERIAGTTKYSPLSLIKLALTAITELSTTPLKLIWWLAGIMALLSIIMIVLGKNLYSVILFAGFVPTFALGLTTAYIGRIYDETRNRPLYIVDKTFNLD